jgi:hypothetical protein
MRWMKFRLKDNKESIVDKGIPDRVCLNEYTPIE